MKALVAAALFAASFAVSAQAQPASSTPAPYSAPVCLKPFEAPGEIGLIRTKVVDPQTILFYTPDGKVWKNVLATPCRGLMFHGFSYVTNYPELCSNAVAIRVIKIGEVCRLGTFVPYTSPATNTPEALGDGGVRQEPERERLARDEPGARAREKAMKCVAPAMLAAVLSVPAALAQAPQANPQPGPICLRSSLIDHTRALDDRTLLFYMKDNKVWISRMRTTCIDLKINGFIYVATPPEDICGGLQSIRVLRTGSVCILGRFEPYTPPSRLPGAATGTP